MNNAVLIVAIICATILLALVILLVSAVILAKRRDRAIKKAKEDFEKNFNFDLKKLWEEEE